jgi:hypothetical protein
MTIITHDDKEYQPILFDHINYPKITNVITCVLDVNPLERDMFGNIVHHKINIKDIKGFKGTLQLSPVYLSKSQMNTKTE